MTLPFDKYEGLGNDFVLVRAAREDEVPAHLARALCDRRFGVGGDGVLLLLPPRDPAHAARMKVINADGSVPEMCGNGLRCVALALARDRGLRTAELLIETDAGLRACTVLDGDDEATVTIDMGVVRGTGDVAIPLADGERVFALADAGNPHAITFEPTDDATLRRIGPLVATHERFPAGTNVEFARIHPGGIDVTVWERGVGLTHACGTGACATLAVACEKGLAAWDTPTALRLPGGVLTITLRRADHHAIMRGPARRAFRGTF